MLRIKKGQIDIEKIANSGQVFRFNKINDNQYILVAKDRVLRIIEEDNEYIFKCSEKEYQNIWKDYFDMDTDYAKFSKNVPKEDEFLNSAIEYGKGIRILKQDKWEMLISFIISQRKSIPAIKSSIEKLAIKFGKEIEEGIFAFPTPKALADASIEDLNKCSLGYRSEYIKEVSRVIYNKDLDLEEISKLDTQELLIKLMQLKGVGIKVANCVALFGYYKIDTFPIDVWIKRIIDIYYNGDFPIKRYDEYKGIIQQYMFYYGRETKVKLN